jgi:hypothetical protein
MAALTTQNIVAAGTAPTMVAAAASDTAEIGDGRNTFAVYKNTSANVTTVTAVAPGNNSYGSANPDPTFSLGDGSVTPTWRWIPLRKEYDPADGTGRATLTTSQQTGITVAIVRMG